jgi:glutaredoxin
MMLTMNQLNTSVPASSQSTTPGRAARIVRFAAVAVLLGAAAAGAMAQYKIVGPDGQVTYTDKPPSPSDIRIGGGNANSSSGAVGGLPFETRQASAKYPVTLYASKSCQPCDAARQWLRGRGVPFGEFSVDNDRSVAQLQQRFGSTTVPVVTVGGQTVSGFSAGDMQSYIDAAGYPAQARLQGYSWPAAVPLAPALAPVPVTAQKAAPAAPAAPATPPVAPPTSSNGIQF